MVIRDELLARGVRTPIAVVPTGVDLECFSPGEATAARVGLGLDPRDPVVLYVGRLDREKSVERVLLAFERLAGTIRRASLWLVGQGKEMEALGRQAGRLAAGCPRVRATGAPRARG